MGLLHWRLRIFCVAVVLEKEPAWPYPSEGVVPGALSPRDQLRPDTQGSSLMLSQCQPRAPPGARVWRTLHLAGLVTLATSYFLCCRRLGKRASMAVSERRGCAWCLEPARSAEAGHPRLKPYVVAVSAPCSSWSASMAHFAPRRTCYIGDFVFFVLPSSWKKSQHGRIRA